MKRSSIKRILFFVFIISGCTLAAQTQLGMKLAPVVVSNRATNEAQSVENDGSALKFSIGLVVDKPISDSYFLSSGLIYVPKRLAFRTDSATSEEYTVQYLQIPLSLKLFANEVAPDIKPYFQIGAGLEIKVFDEPTDPDYVVVEKFNPIDFSVLIGAGVEYRAGINTTLFAGISYHRGLVNAVNETIAGADDLQLRNTVFSIDFGVKF